MKRLFRSLAVIVGIWLICSFLGVMFDPARANLWTKSLMWALLSCVILAPVFLFVGTSAGPSSSQTSPRAERPFDADEELEVQEDTVQEDEGWPYTSEQDETNPDGPSAFAQSN